jgi:hypothetical protein
MVRHPGYQGSLRVSRSLNMTKYAALMIYRPVRIKAPDAIARIAMSVPSPEKWRLSRGTSPVRMPAVSSRPPRRGPP